MQFACCMNTYRMFKHRHSCLSYFITEVVAVKKNVLVFSDFGIDDFVAVIYAYFNEEVEIVGVVADYGNVSKSTAVRNAAYFQKVTGREDIPVFGGAEIPLTGRNPQLYPDIHGIGGLGPLTPEIDIANDPFENFDEIKKIIEKYEGNLTILNLGRLSSLATAFILYPSWMAKITDFYIMGGAFTVPGNVTPVAEANFYGDPYATNIIIEFAPKQLHIIPLDVTQYALITPEMINRLDHFYQSVNSDVGLLVKPMVDYYYQFYKERDPTIRGSPLHDVLTMWAIQEDSIIDYAEIPTTIVVNTGDAFGESIGDFRKIEDKANYPHHKVATQFYYPKFIDSFFRIMTNVNAQ